MRAARSTVTGSVVPTAGTTPDFRVPSAVNRTEPVTGAASSPITDKHAALGGDAGVLGPAIDVEYCGLRDGGCHQDFTAGQIVWSPSTGARALTDPDVYREWEAWGLEDGPLGYPTSDTFCGLVNGGCGQHFEGGSVYTSPATGAWAFDAATLPAWAAASWERGLGYPTADLDCTLQDGNCLQRFERGIIYWSPMGAFAVPRGPVEARWAAGAWERGWLGFPTSGQFCGLRGGGCGQHFEGGSIYWSPATGARAVAADGYGRWAAQGWEQGGLGYPTSEPFLQVDGSYGQHFQGGSLYEKWGDVRVVPAAIRTSYQRHHWERGPLGGPTSEAFCGLRNGGCGQHFVGGTIYWSPATGAAAVRGLVLQGYEFERWEQGALGYPTTEVFCGLRGGGCGQHFQGGSLYTRSHVADMANGWVAVPVLEPFLSAWAAQGWERGAWGYPLSGPRYADGRTPYPMQVFEGGNKRLVDGRFI